MAVGFRGASYPSLGQDKKKKQKTYGNIDESLAFEVDDKGRIVRGQEALKDFLGMSQSQALDRLPTGLSYGADKIRKGIESGMLTQFRPGEISRMRSQGGALDTQQRGNIPSVDGLGPAGRPDIKGFSDGRVTNKKEIAGKSEVAELNQATPVRQTQLTPGAMTTKNLATDTARPPTGNTSGGPEGFVGWIKGIYDKLAGATKAGLGTPEVVAQGIKSVSGFSAPDRGFYQQQAEREGKVDQAESNVARITSRRDGETNEGYQERLVALREDWGNIDKVFKKDAESRKYHGDFFDQALKSADLKTRSESLARQPGALITQGDFERERDQLRRLFKNF